MPLLIVALAVAILLLLMTKFKQNGFVALLLVSILVGFWGALTGHLSVDDEEVGIEAIPDILADGVGGQLSHTIIVIALGAMIGRVMGDAGAAQRVAETIVQKLGAKNVQWAMVITSMLIGITMFYESAFVIIVPVAFTLVRATKCNLLWVGLPLSISLSTMHSFLPPHPGPVAAATMYEASVGRTILYGLCFAVPIGAFIALTWTRLPFVKAMNPSIPEGLVTTKQFSDEEMPSIFPSVAVAIFPVILIGGAEIFKMVTGEDAPGIAAVEFFGSTEIALLITLLIAVIVFGPMMGISLDKVGHSMTDSAKAMAMIILVIGAGGAFKQVLVATGTADYIAEMTGNWDVNPIILVWITAVFLRIALGSATVAVSTAAGIAAPLVAVSGVSPELMVLATACGSIAFSHVNDPGFWMFKEYFNLSVIDTIKVRTTYTTTLSILGLGGTLLLSLVV